MWLRRDLPELSKLWQQGSNDADAEDLQKQKAGQTSDLEKLKSYLQGQGQQQKADIDLSTLQRMKDQGLTEDGGSAKAGELATGSDPYSKMMMQGPHEAKTFQGIADKTFKPINDTLDASKATLDNLNAGNSTSDKLALINEAKLSLAGSGGRAIGQMVSHLAGDPSLASDGQKALNWLQNTPNIPTLQPAQRNAIRESVFSRLDQTEQQGTQAAATLGQQGPALAPHADYNSILSSYTTPAMQKLQGLRKMQSQYQQQRQGQQAAGNPAVSAPSTASQNPTTLDKLKGFLTGGGQQQQAPQPQTMRVKHIGTGQTGTIPASEYDPSIYQQVQ